MYENNNERLLLVKKNLGEENKNLYFGASNLSFNLQLKLAEWFEKWLPEELSDSYAKELDKMNYNEALAKLHNKFENDFLDYLAEEDFNLYKKINRKDIVISTRF